MRKIDYMNTLQFRIRDCNRKARENNFMFKYESSLLLTKGSNARRRIEETINFQNLLHTQLVQSNKRAFTSQVAVNIEIEVNQRNAPHIQSIPKFYIDLIYTVSEHSEIRRKFLILKDDDQIKYLSVQYRPSRATTSSITFSVRPYNQFINQIELLEECRYKVGDSDSWDEDERYMEDDNWEDLHEHLRNRSELIQLLGYDRYEFERFSLLRRSQTSYYNNQRLKNHSLCSLLSKRSKFQQDLISGDPKLAELISMVDESTIEAHVQMSIEGLPQRTGEGDIFRANIESKIERFLHSTKILLPTLIPISVTIIFGPPRNYNKDLDNLARIVLPILLNKFGPPTTIINSLQDIELEFFRAIQERRNRTTAQSDVEFPLKGLSAYRIITIDPTPSDPPGGYIKLSIHNARTYQELITYVDRNLFECESKIEKDC